MLIITGIREIFSRPPIPWQPQRCGSVLLWKNREKTEAYPQAIRACEHQSVLILCKILCHSYRTILSIVKRRFLLVKFSYHYCVILQLLKHHISWNNRGHWVLYNGKYTFSLLIFMLLKGYFSAIVPDLLCPLYKTTCQHYFSYI